jgi:HSP20 family protein
MFGSDVQSFGAQIVDEIRRLFGDLARDGHECSHLADALTPPIDLIETADRFEVRLDLPGMRAEALRVVLRGDTLIVAGQKAAPDLGAGQCVGFHLVERRFGRVARVVRLTGAIEGAGARATLASGELSVVVPKRAERRGGEISIPVRTGG